MDLKEALESICGLILAAKIGLVRRPILDSGGSTSSAAYDESRIVVVVTPKIGFKNHHHGGFGYQRIFLSKAGPLATRIWTLAPPKSAQQSVLNLMLEIRANG